MKKLLFIINPVTARLAVTPHLIDIVDIFEKGGYDVTVHISKAKGEVTDYVAENGANFNTVVCAGGDGTLNETIAGVLTITENKPEIGYIPSGTTNDFAGSWGIPKKPLDAARAIVEKTPRKADISTFCGRPYVYVAAFGAFTKASYSTPQEMKKTLGWAAYIIEGIKSIPTIRPTHVKIEYDGETIEGDYLYGMISNTKHVGGFELKLKDEISLDDGLMELILVKKPDAPTDNGKMIAAILAQDTTGEYFTIHHIKNAHFTFDTETAWTIDGECGGELTEVTGGIIESAIELYY